MTDSRSPNIEAGSRPAIGTKAWFAGSTLPQPTPAEIETFSKLIAARDSINEVFNLGSIQHLYKAYNVVRGIKCGYIHKNRHRLARYRDIATTILTQYETTLKNIARGIKPTETKSNTSTKSQLITKAIDLLIDDGVKTRVSRLASKHYSDIDLNVILEPLFDDATIEAVSGVARMISAYLFLSEQLGHSPCDMNLILKPRETPLYDGRLYLVFGKASWNINLAWLLAHMHRDSIFLVLAEDLQGLRFSKSRPNEICDFAKEIAVLVKLGYQMSRNDQGCLMLKHPDAAKVRNLTLVDLAMTDEELHQYYSIAIKLHSKLPSKEQALKLREDNVATERSGANQPRKRRARATVKTAKKARLFKPQQPRAEEKSPAATPATPPPPNITK